MRPLAAALLSASILLLLGCDLFGASGGAGAETPIYSTSFESAADTSGWTGNGTLALRSSAPGGGGTQSALVSGGCIWPHSAYEFPAPAGGTFVLQAWAKDLGIGGGITLENVATDKRVSVRVQEDTWKQLRSETLSVETGDSLRLTMGAGGFVASAMLVTRIEILPARRAEE
jgi:hypothetical protein